MTKKKAIQKGEAKANVEVSPVVKAATETESVANAELVNEAGIDIELETEEKAAPKEAVKKSDEAVKAPVKEREVSLFTTVINTSQNPILLKGADKEESLLIAPREIKSVRRDVLKSLLRNKIVRYWFDKGILTSNYDANETTANEAVAPEYLKQPVERHDGANISASVTKFKKEGSVSINL